MNDARRFDLSPSYGATSDGRILRFDSKRFLKPCVMKRGGYLGVSLWESGVPKAWPVHQIVCYAWHGDRPTPKHHAAHRDGDKKNNHETNLRWTTKVENEHDKIAHGRTNRGERNGAAKVTNAQAAEIIRRAATLPRSSGGCRIKKGELPKLAGEYGITAGAAYLIINGYRRSA